MNVWDYLGIAFAWLISLAVVARTAYIRGSKYEMNRYLQGIRRAPVSGSSARRATVTPVTPEDE